MVRDRGDEAGRDIDYIAWPDGGFPQKTHEVRALALFVVAAIVGHGGMIGQHMLVISASTSGTSQGEPILSRTLFQGCPRTLIDTNRIVRKR